VYNANTKPNPNPKRIKNV